MDTSTVQGDFAARDAAERAKAELVRSGVAESRIRIWNIIPDSGTAKPSGGNAATGALVGGAVGGGAGLVAGAAIGAALGEDGPRLPLPSGVRIVVDTAGDGEQVRARLHSAGATNIH